MHTAHAVAVGYGRGRRAKVGLHQSAPELQLARCDAEPRGGSCRALVEPLEGASGILAAHTASLPPRERHQQLRQFAQPVDGVAVAPAAMAAHSFTHIRVAPRSKT